MYRRGLALCLSFATASLTLADARINLVPTVPGPYAPGAVVTVNITLEQVGETATARMLRMVGLDFSDSNASLIIPNAGPVWSLGGLADCAGHPGTPCSAYYFDADLGAATFGPKTASMAYYFKNSNNLGPNAAGQLSVPASGTVQVGTIQVTCPMAAGTYRLDVLNADEADVNRGSVVYWGFGIDQADPVRIYRPANASPNDLLGGTLDIVVMVPGGDAELTGSSPPSCTAAGGGGSSLWRSTGNVILLDFNADITAPGAGQIEINQLLTAGAFGPNLNTGSAFTITVENNNRRLRIVDSGGPTGIDLAHRNWYTIRNTGAWAGVEPFSVKLVVQVGDVTNDGRVLAADVSAINACIPCANVSAGCSAQCQTPHERREITGDNRILAADASTANASIPSANVNIPAGHTCP